MFITNLYRVHNMHLSKRPCYYVKDLCYPPTFTMLPTINHDLEFQFGAGVKHEIQEQSRNDKDHTTSNTEQKTSTTRAQQENKEHNTMPQ